MSETAKKVNQAPESYSPKKPEIIKMTKDYLQTEQIVYFVHGQDGDSDSLETDRLIIRHFREDDWQDVKELAESQQRYEYAEFDEVWPTDDATVRDITNYFSSEPRIWAVEIKDLHKVIVFVNFNGIKYENHMDIGHIMNDAYYHQGYEYEALAVLYDHCFRTMDVGGICAHWVMGEKLKLEPLAKLGMELTCVGPDEDIVVKEDGKVLDGRGCMARISRTEWESNNPTVLR